MKIFILKKKWIKVIMKEIIINPKNISRKKLLFIFNLVSLPYPDTDNDNKTILTINISIWRNIMSNHS